MADATVTPNRNVWRATLGISVVLGLGILVLVNWLGARHYRRLDWTRSKLYSLSDKTVQVLKGLKTPVKATVFMSEGSPLWAETQEVLRRYREKSPMISVETLDPARNRARAESLVKEFGVRGGTVVFQAGDKKKYVTEDQLAELDYARARMGGEPTIKAFKGEQEFTSAILTVTESKTPKVLFTTGHGERDVQGRGADGYYATAEILRRDNCDVQPWQTLGATAVPTGADLVVVADPKAPFTAPEAALLGSWLKAGGRALFLLDVDLVPGGGGQWVRLGLEGTLAELGVRLDDDAVVDPVNALPMMSADTVFAKSYKPHPITRPLMGPPPLPVVLRLARSVGVVEKAPAGLTGTVLVETSADGWGETDLAHADKVQKDDKDVKGPVPLAVAVEGTGGAKTRAVVVGDADFASNRGLSEAANLYLANGAVNWLLAREALVAIPPKAADQVAVTLSRGDMATLTLVVLLVLPALAIALGLAVWLRRRR